jgi:hypothetical protein
MRTVVESGVRAAEWRADQDRWRAERAYLKTHRRELTRQAAVLYPDAERFAGSPLLTRSEWLPAHPVPLDAIKLAWTPPPVPTPVTGGEPESAGVRPLRATSDRFPRYSAAIGELDPPRLFENRPTYRLTEAKLIDIGRMGFSEGRYFDATDVGEAAAHELAGVVYAGQSPDLARLPLRRLVGDPTDPGRRSMPTAITTLTIRYDAERDDARFLAHWRDPAKVAANGGMYTVVPVGMFQPAGTASGAGPGDFDLWRGMAREYSEELLGAAEHADVDYDDWPFFRQLTQARQARACRPYCLGIGVDPLTLAVDVLAVTVFDASAFDSLFAELVEENDEGRIPRSPDGTPGLPFTAEEVHQLVEVEHTQPAGAAVLGAAWRMRDALLSP